MAIETENPSVRQTESQAPTTVVDTDDDASAKPSWFEKIRKELLKARNQEVNRKPADLARDRSKPLVAIGAIVIVLVLVFLGVFSSPDSSKQKSKSKPSGVPDLGLREVPGDTPPPVMGSVTPLLRADSPSSPVATNNGSGRGDRLYQPSSSTRDSSRDGADRYALDKIDFDSGQTNLAPSKPNESEAVRAKEGEELKKPSLVFVQSAALQSANTTVEAGPLLNLATGTRLVARLEEAVNSAVPAPVLAAIEVDFSRNGEIVVPAGARAYGSLTHADISGNVRLHFDTLEMPDGSQQKINADSVSLTSGTLKGQVKGKTNAMGAFLRAMTGSLSFLSYREAGSSFSGALIADRAATGVSAAGDQALNSLSLNQTVYVTLPAKMRFYLEIQRNNGNADTRSHSATQPRANALPPATLDQYRQFLQWQREMRELNQQPIVQGEADTPPK